MKNNPVKTIEKLNRVLADLQIVYQNFRTMHWLIKGAQFFRLHTIYEEYYTETAEVVDEVAERILMLGGIPFHQLSDYIENASVKQVTEVPAGTKSVKTAIESFEYLLDVYRDINSYAAETEDEGTAAMFSDYIRETEKKIWMLKSTIA